MKLWCQWNSKHTKSQLCLTGSSRSQPCPIQLLSRKGFLKSLVPPMLSGRSSQLYCCFYLDPKHTEAYIHNYSSLLPTVQVFLSRSLDAPAFHPLMLESHSASGLQVKGKHLNYHRKKKKNPHLFVVIVSSVRSPNTSVGHYKHCYTHCITYSVPCCFMLLLMYAFQLCALKHSWIFVNHKNHSSKILITLYYTLNLDWSL